jgi:hypothetical protein
VEGEIATYDRVINEIEGELQRPGLTANDRAQIEADLEAMRSRQAEFAGQLERFRLDPAAGQADARGYIATESRGRAQAASLGYEKAPDGYHWAQINGSLYIRRNPGTMQAKWYNVETRQFENVNELVPAHFVRTASSPYR